MGDINLNHCIQVDSWRSLHAFISSILSLHPASGIRDPVSLDKLEPDCPNGIVDKILYSELFDAICAAVVSQQWWLFEVSGHWISTFVKLCRLRPHYLTWKKLIRVVEDANKLGKENEWLSTLLYQLRNVLYEHKSDDLEEEP